MKHTVPAISMIAVSVATIAVLAQQPPASPLRIRRHPTLTGTTSSDRTRWSGKA